MTPLDRLRNLPYTIFSCHHPPAGRVLLAEGWIEKCRSCWALRKRLDDQGRGPSPYWWPEGRRQTFADGQMEMRTMDGRLLGRVPLGDT